MAVVKTTLGTTRPRAAVLCQNMIENGKLTFPGAGQTISRKSNTARVRPRTLAVLLFAYISLPCVNLNKITRKEEQRLGVWGGELPVVDTILTFSLMLQ